MKILLFWVGALALALLAVPVAAQTTPSAPLFKNSAGQLQEGIVTTPVTLATTSTAQRGTVTSSTATATSGSASFAGGIATIGPLAPQLGRPVHVRLFGTWAGTVYLGTSSDNCATITPLTVGGQSWGSFTANANEDVDVPFRSSIGECLSATITSGTLTYSVDQ